MGRRVCLPMTLETAEIVDPVPMEGGMINGNTKIGFDKQGPALSFRTTNSTPTETPKSITPDAKKDGWKIYQTTDWKDRLGISAAEVCIGFQVSVGPVHVDGKGRLVQHYRSPKAGGLFELDEEALKQLHPVQPTEPHMPKEITRKQSDFPGLRVRIRNDLAGTQDGTPTGQDQNVRYVMRWEARGVNRDRPFEGPLPGRRACCEYISLLEAGRKNR